MKRFLDSDICRSALKLQSKRSTYFVWCFYGGDALRFVERLVYDAYKERMPVDGVVCG